MNEEEKKAVEILNTFELRRKTKNYKEISLEDSQSVETLLNLIEKLQNENKKLKKRGKYMNKKCTNCNRFPLCIYQNDCIISKDFKDNVAHYNQIKNYWIKRDVEMKLDSKSGNNFTFKKI